MIRLKNIVLIGMPGSGKSTIGARLAKNLHYPLIDTDRLIMDTTGHTLPELLQIRGLEGFLALEGQVGAQLACEGCVIATGGSMVLSETAMRNLKRESVTVWLDTALTELERRIRANADRGIAAKPGTTIEEIDAVRRPLYARYADIHLHTAGSVGHMVAQLMEALQAYPLDEARMR